MEWSGGNGVEWHPVEAVGDGGFTRLEARETGVTFVNHIPEDQLATDRVLGNGSGLALGDYDGDGWTDLFVVGLDGELVLYRNLGDWRFHDVTRESGIRAQDRRYTGASFADTDGDGDLDLLVTAIRAPLTFFRNEGGRFEEATTAAGLDGPEGGLTPTLADVDGDGDLDLYVSNYKRHFALDVLEDVASGRTPIVQRTPSGIRITPGLEEHYILITTPMGQRTEEKGDPDWFFVNQGDGRFRLAPYTERFLDSDGRPMEEAPAEFALSARFYDVNGDGHPDLYVCNDFAHADRLWLGDGQGRFTLAGPEVLRSTSHASMGVDFGDVDRNGVVDIVVMDMLSVEERRRRAQELGMFGWPTRTPGGVDRVRQVDRNTLQLGRGDGTFAEIGQYAGISASDWSWTPLLLDGDLDGYEDLFIVNGYHWDALNGDALAALRAARSARAWARFDSLPDPNVAFRNRGDLTFGRARDWGFGPDADIAMGLAAADLDNDGDLDMVASRWADPPALYRNDAPAPRVAIRLRGRAPNTQAIGAVIHVEGGPVAQRQEVTLGGHYLSSSDPVLTFAAGSADTLTVRVRWRDGSWTDSIPVRPGRVYRIHQEATDTASPPPAPARPDPLFEDASAQLGGHTHAEPHFDDFGRQPLLPSMLSRMGPGVSWIDVTGDGREDLLVAGGDGELTTFVNRSGRLQPRAEPVAETDTELFMALPHGAGVLLTQSRYDEGGGTQRLREAPPVMAVESPGAGPAPVLAPDTGTFAAMARADV
ncbi:MAG: VCBS repeat-containing protein, partial [Longimicrobiales bacterium]|nr:VCBS repeat-containing protein [Longimicrobiales bacterium]